MAKVLCVEVGYQTIKIVEMDYQKKSPKVYRYVSCDTPKGVIRDGYLSEEHLEQLAQVIKKVLTENKIRTKRVLFSICSGKIISREILIPGVKPVQIGAVIQANITEYFPIELDDYKVSYLLIKTFHEGENAGKHKVLIIAAEKKFLQGYENLAELLNLRLVDIDYAGNGIFQAIKNSAGAEGILVARVEEENCIITIAKHGVLVLQRNVNTGFADAKSTEIVEENRIQLINTIQRIIDFYGAQSEENTIKKIYLAGSCSENEDLKRQIETQTMTVCKRLDKIRGVHLHSAIEDLPVSLFATVVGSGVSSIGFSNEKEKERHETNYLNASLLMLILILVLVTGIFSMSMIPYLMAEMEEKEIARKEEVYAPAKEVYEQYTSVKGIYEQVKIGHEMTLHSNDGIIDFLEELEEMLPVDVEVTEFASNDTDCVMTMRVSDKETAAKIIDNLRQFESIEQIQVSSIMEESKKSEEDEIEVSEDTKVYFSINCTYRKEQASVRSNGAEVVQTESMEEPID